LIKLAGIGDCPPFPDENYFNDNIAIWNSNIGEVVKAEVAPEQWIECCNIADREFGNIGGLKKNALHISRSCELAWNQGLSSVSLTKACELIAAFGNRI